VLTLLYTLIAFLAATTAVEGSGTFPVGVPDPWTMGKGKRATSDVETMAKPRRQQGILTGMPFMANVAKRTFVDDLGRKIFLAKPPVRVVSMAPSVTESLYALGFGEYVVGVSQFCDFPPEVLAKPKVGYARPNLEALVALRPDLVLAPKEVLRGDVLAKLDQMKIATFVLDSRTIEDVLAHLQTISRIFQRPETGDELAAVLRRRIETIKSKTTGLSRPRVLYVLSSDPLITVGPGSFIHRMIELAGGTNVAADAPIAYPRLSMEEVLKRDPEILIFPVGGAEAVSDDEQQVWRRWNRLSAVRENRFYGIDSNLLNRPGPRVIDGLQALAHALHPEITGTQ
jgi:iron complex transport system substrate-binding protein